MNQPHHDPHHPHQHHADEAHTNKTKLILQLTVGTIVIVALASLATLNFSGSTGEKYQTRGKLEAVCDVVVQRPVDGLSQPFEVSKLPLPVVIDLDEMTGAYAGEYSISLNRKGTLRVDGDNLEILRQAMFKRYGITIQGEHAELNRKTGEFRQWLDLGNDKHLTLMTGKCRRKDNAPF
ncbi:MAG: hypothetical protein RL404_2409 [Pseudomonadota bacterium]|jgi:hypothetical protein